MINKKNKTISGIKRMQTIHVSNTNFLYQVHGTIKGVGCSIPSVFVVTLWFQILDRAQFT